MRNALISRAAWIKSRPFVIGLIGLVLLLALYLVQLDRPGLLSDREYAAVTASAHLHAILTDPLDAPIKLVRWALLQAGTSTVSVRLPGVLVAIVSTFFLYSLMRRWHGRRIAVPAACLFAASCWLLQTARTGGDLALYSLMPLALFWFGSWLNSAKRSGLALCLMALLYAALLYVPGAIWFEIISVLLLRPVIMRHLRTTGAAWAGISFVVWLTAVAWLVVAFVRNHSLIMPWLGLQHGLPRPLQALDQWIHSASFLVRGPESGDLWVGHHPLLDAFSLVALLLGLYMYIRHWRNLRVYLLAGFGLLGTLMVAANGIDGINYLLPTLYLVIGTGLTHLLHEWYVIFPRNPVARWVGTSVVAIAVLIACSYHMTAYFVAWQRSPTTAAAFRQPL